MMGLVRGVALIVGLTVMVAVPHGNAKADVAAAPLQASQAAVDRAWDVYHEAALGGTLASPQLQSRIERALHEARTFLAQAWDALERGDTARLEALLTKIQVRTEFVQRASREPKR